MKIEIKEVDILIIFMVILIVGVIIGQWNADCVCGILKCKIEMERKAFDYYGGNYTPPTEFDYTIVKIE